MNEYQDQATWFEVQGLYNGRWEMVTAEDTRPEANKRQAEYIENEPETLFRVRRVRGLA